MAARRIGQYVPDWIKIATKVPHEARPNMSAMRAKYETIKTRYVSCVDHESRYRLTFHCAKYKLKLKLSFK